MLHFVFPIPPFLQRFQTDCPHCGASQFDTRRLPFIGSGEGATQSCSSCKHEFGATRSDE